MKRFSETLQEIHRRLDLPQPAKSRVVLEIAADLRDLHSYFRDSGMSDAEAYERAVEQCDLSDDALAQLAQIHTAPWRRFLDRLSAQGQSRWERTLLIVLLLFIAASTGRLMLSADLFRAAGAAVWPILGVTAAAFCIGLEKCYRAYLKQDHNLRRLRAGLPSLLVLAGLVLIMGMYAYWLKLFRTSSGAAADLNGAVQDATAWLVAGSAMLIVDMMCALAIAFLWFVLANKIARIEQAEAAVLLME